MPPVAASLALLESSANPVALSRVVVCRNGEGGYDAECLDILVVAEGSTIQEALDSLLDNAEAALNSQRHDGISFRQAAPARLESVWRGDTADAACAVLCAVLLASSTCAEGKANAGQGDLLLVHSPHLRP